MEKRSDLQTLLEKTSRTFALAIPLLPEPTRTEVMLAYLVLRIADTFEDADNLSCSERADALEQFAELLKSASATDVEAFTDRWTRTPPCEDVSYLALLKAAPAVFEALGMLDAEAQQIIRRHTVRSTLGMRAMLRDDDSCQIRLESLDQLREYCYFVAGIVGELLTELFERRLEADYDERLVQRAAVFGEGLQLVNVLKDEQQDAERGRYFLPPAASRAQVFQLARDDLDMSREYVQALVERRADAGTVAFTLLPLRLADATLDCLQREGPGAKIPRSDVFRILREVLEFAAAARQA